MPARLLSLIAGLTAVTAGFASAPATAQEPPPQTGFEQRNGASWTTHQEELDFLSAVDARSDRVSVSDIGRSVTGKPLQLVQIGHPQPHGREAALAEPTLLFVCSQHGNEPAGREACLIALRDMAFTSDPKLIELMSRITILVIPTANPDGREANSRGNGAGIDTNRDHLNLRTPEAQTMAEVVRDWKPDMAVDYHEYGPSIPVLYDDDILYLWPRNLNVDPLIRSMGKSFSQQSLKPCVNAAGYTADEYGLQAVGDVDVAQTAGDQDEGIMRNTMGLRHVIGILIESAVSPSTNPQQLPNEPTTAGQQRRRVASQRKVIDCTFEYFGTNAAAIKQATDHAPLRKMGEGFALSSPVYFGGADNDPPTASEEVYPPPCAYELTAAQAQALQPTFDLHGIRTVATETGARVPLGQPAEPLIPLLLDARGARKTLSATPLPGVPLDSACTLPPEEGGIPEPGSGAAGAAGGSGAAAAVGLGALGLEARRKRRRDSA
jgi:hypothetical protein